MHEETSEEPVMDIQAGKHHCLDEKNLTSNCRQKWALGDICETEMAELDIQGGEWKRVFRVMARQR